MHRASVRAAAERDPRTTISRRGGRGDHRPSVSRRAAAGGLDLRRCESRRMTLNSHCSGAYAGCCPRVVPDQAEMCRYLPGLGALPQDPFQHRPVGAPSSLGRRGWTNPPALNKSSSPIEESATTYERPRSCDRRCWSRGAWPPHRQAPPVTPSVECPLVDALNIGRWRGDCYSPNEGSHITAQGYPRTCFRGR